jgi:hypothetical protein
MVKTLDSELYSSLNVRSVGQTNVRVSQEEDSLNFLVNVRSQERLLLNQLFKLSILSESQLERYILRGELAIQMAHQQAQRCSTRARLVVAWTLLCCCRWCQQTGNPPFGRRRAEDVVVVQSDLLMRHSLIDRQFDVTVCKERGDRRAIESTR